MNATPIPELEDPALAPRLALPPRRNPAGAGWDWIVSGWRLFKRAPLMWVLSMVVVFVVAMVVNIVPILGSLAFQLLQAVVAGGFMVACHSLSRGGDFEIEHLMAGFKRHFGRLMLLGVFLIVSSVVIMLVLFVFFGTSVVSAYMTSGGDPEAVARAIMGSAMLVLLGGLVALALTIPMLAAYWFAPALVILNDMTVGAALKESFVGCFRNFVPFLVYGIVMTILAIVAAIPFGLGFLVWLPLAVASTYAAYRAIYTDPPTDEPAVQV